MKTRIIVIVCVAMFANNLLAENEERRAVEASKTFLEQLIESLLHAATKATYAGIGAGSVVPLPPLSTNGQPAMSKPVALGIFVLLTAAHFNVINGIPDEVLKDPEYKRKARRREAAKILMNGVVTFLAAYAAAWFPAAVVPAFGAFLFAEVLCSGKESVMERLERALADGLGYIPYL
jgi:hypothetical protein